MRVTILGAGQMGTAFGAPLLERGHEVCFWGPEWLDGARLDALAAGKPHPELGARLSASPVETSTELDEAVERADVCALAVSSEGIGWVAEKVAVSVSEDIPVLVLTKGFAERGGEVLPVAARVREILGGERPVIGVGGPVKASELIRKLPTQTVFASEDTECGEKLASAFGTSYYLPEITGDLVGTSLCAALKNCYAIAVNLLAGEVESANLRSLAFSAALREIFLFVAAAGGLPETVAGAAGSGDLYVTCLTGRNGDFGRLLGEGNSPEEARGIMEGATVEGLGTLPLALGLARSLGLGEKLPLLSYLDEVLRVGGTEKVRLPLERIVSG
ncbi:MAG: NAD(P)H-dependent glycerol-3-phosphate dehydrogenase [Rubrobacteraceae bacterium]